MSSTLEAQADSRKAHELEVVEQSSFQLIVESSHTAADRADFKGYS
jgi:hypothetical protein